MPAATKAHARKKREDKLDWEELESAPNVEGMYSFLKPQAPEPPPSVPPPSVSLPGPIQRVNRLRVHRCQRIQDAHTPGEQLLLSTLYELAQDPRYAQPVGDGSWVVSVSMAELAERIGMHETNIRMNIRSLTAKLAIDLAALEDRHKQSARQYRLYSPEQILERRTKAGFEWVVKNRGVHFVDPKTGKPTGMVK